MKRTFWILGALAILFSVSTAQATPILDFGTGSSGTGGTITASGSGWIGANIPVDTLTVDGTSHNGTFDLLGTGTGSSVDANGAAVLSFNTNTGAITVTGGVVGAIFSNLSSPVVLLSGTISGFEVSNVGGVLHFEATGPDTKNANLLVDLGLPSNTAFQFFGFTIQSQNGTVISTDITNTAIPEPATMLLLGAGLIGLAGYGRKKLN